MATRKGRDFRRNHHRRGSTSDSVANLANKGHVGGLQPVIPPLKPTPPIRPI
jgi:hypothetical protein